MRLKSLMTALLLTASVLGLHAQDGTDQKIVFGARAGLNLSMTSARMDGASGGMKAGFQVGATADFNVAKNIWVNTGLFYSLKGHKFEYSKNTAANYTTSLSFLQVPVLASYHIPFSGCELQLNAGPYIGIGLSGNIKYDDGREDADYFDVFDKSRFDYGLMGSAGLLFSEHYLLSAGYEYGMGDISNKNIFITFGYNF